MLQESMTKPGEIEFAEVERPVIRDNEILVKMMRIGICGSDIHVYHGTHPYTGYPVTQGHEVSGIIEEVGKDVNGHRVYPDGTPAPDLHPGQDHSAPSHPGGRARSVYPGCL